MGAGGLPPSREGPQTFGAQLQRQRLLAGLSQAELAARAGLSQRGISDLERGLRQAPYLATIRRLAEALGLAEAERAVLLAASRHASSTQASAPTAKPTPAEAPATNRQTHNLPRQLTSFIGRERDLAELRRLLVTSPLLTLTGPGGAGKTRLALQVAAELVGTFTDGVWFVDLAPLRDPTLVVANIGQALGLREGGGQSWPELVRQALRHQRLLLVLDNFEHLLPAAPSISELLASCPDLVVLATSRSALHLRGEQEYVVPPLESPDPRLLPTLERLAEYEVVRLFVGRARVARADFVLTADNATAVAALSARQDPKPLAIELAAARVKHLTAQALLSRLDRRLPLLVGGAQDLPARQQTMRATIAWSYELLNEAEKALFRRLAVFAGGCTLEAAEAVCAGGDIAAAEVLGRLARLVDHSLVMQAQADGEPRFALLETIREYALEQLEASGEVQALERRHATYYLALAEAAEPELRRARQATWLERLEREHDNLRTALQFYAAERAPAEMELRLSRALWLFWKHRGHIAEGRRCLEHALSHGGDGPPAARPAALDAAGDLARQQADYPRAAALHQEALALGRALGDKRSIANSLIQLAMMAIIQADYERATDLCTQALPLGDTWVVAEALTVSGFAARERGDQQRAAALCSQSLTLRHEIGDKRGISQCLLSLGNLALDQGDYERAAAVYSDALAVLRELDDKLFLALALNNLGVTMRHRGEPGRARALHVESLRVCWETGDKRVITYCLEGLALVASAQGQPERAARLFGAAEALHDAIGLPLEPSLRAAQDYDRSVISVRTLLGEAGFAVAWAEGRAMPLDQVIHDAMEPAANNNNSRSPFREP